MEENTRNNKNTKLLYALIALLAITVVYMGYKLNSQSTQVSSLLDENNVITTERSELEQGLEEMLQQYDTLNVDNEEMKAEILQQKAEISELLERVKKLKKDDGSLRWEIDKLKKEAGTLRDIMKGYLVTIDSLNTMNKTLVAEVDNLGNSLSEVNEAYTGLSETVKDQNELIKAGSVLVATTFSAEAIRVRNSGAQKATNRAAKAEMIKSCVKLGQNKIAKKGPKTLYLRVISPDGVVLDDKNNMGSTFNFNNVSGKYSAKRQFDYDGTSKDICVFHTVMNTLPAGQYIVEMYESGVLIGKTTFDLR